MYVADKAMRAVSVRRLLEGKRELADVKPREMAIVFEAIFDAKIAILREGRH